MIWRVLIRRNSWTDTVLVEAPNLADASIRVIKEYPEHMVIGVTEDSAIAII